MKESQGPVKSDSVNQQDDSSTSKHPDYRLIMAPGSWERATPHTTPGLFLAGSVERGSVDWRKVMAEGLRPYPVTILNPYRPDWDSTWFEDITCTPFREQVQWELEMIERADIAAVYFGASTEAPITLLELGLMANKGSQNIKVHCAEGYKKRGNVQIVCAKHQFELVASLSELVMAVQRRLQEWQVNERYDQ